MPLRWLHFKDPCCSFEIVRICRNWADSLHNSLQSETEHCLQWLAACNDLRWNTASWLVHDDYPKSSAFGLCGKGSVNIRFPVSPLIFPNSCWNEYLGCPITSESAPESRLCSENTLYSREVGGDPLTAAMFRRVSAQDLVREEITERDKDLRMCSKRPWRNATLNLWNLWSVTTQSREGTFRMTLGTSSPCVVYAVHQLTNFNQHLLPLWWQNLSFTHCPHQPPQNEKWSKSSSIPRTERTADSV